MNTLIPAIRVFLVLTFLTGVIYPLSITGVAQVFFSSKAQGSLILRDGKVRGSELLAQKFQSEKYFWPRPAVNEINPQLSEASNWGATSRDLKKKFEERHKFWEKTHPGQKEVPKDLLFASASGLDPHISPEGALYQQQRVASARGLPLSQVEALVHEHIETPTFGFFGEARVNVLLLNQALDVLNKP